MNGAIDLMPRLLHQCCACSFTIAMVRMLDNQVQMYMSCSIIWIVDLSGQELHLTVDFLFHMIICSDL